VILCVSVVKLAQDNITTEARSLHREPQRIRFPTTKLNSLNSITTMKQLYRRLSIPLLLMGIACASYHAALGQEKTGVTEPKLKLQGLDGRVYDLAGQRGNVVLVSFGATWCAPCSTELRALEELLAEYQNKPVRFYWVSIERPEEVSDSALKRYARERKVSFPVLRDTAKMVFLQFSPRVRLPMIVMLSKDGRVDLPVQFGMRTPAESYKADMRARLNKLLSVRSESDR
jgi:peroxiredoxin